MIEVIKFLCTYTILIISNNIFIYLSYGQINDPYFDLHFYLKDRAVVVLIAILLYNIVKKIIVSKKVIAGWAAAVFVAVRVLVHYLITIFSMVVISICEDFHFSMAYSCDFRYRNYRERFIDDTFIYLTILITYVILSGIIAIIKRKSDKHSVPVK